MANFFNTPLFGLTLSVLAYTLGLLLYRRFPNPLTTPLLVSTALIIVILHYTGISYRDYYVGGSYLNSLIIPSTVALAVPFYKNLHLMRHHYKSILIGSTVACRDFGKNAGDYNSDFGRSCYYRNLDISFRTCLFKDDWY